MFKLDDIVNNFSVSCNVGVSVIDKLGHELFHSSNYANFSGFSIQLTKLLELENQCRFQRLYSSFESLRFGGRYIYFCPLGLMYFISPIIKHHEIDKSVLVGPLLITDPDEYFELDVVKKHSISSNYINELEQLVKKIPYFTPEKVHSMSEMLFLCLSNIDLDETMMLKTSHEKDHLQSVISTYITGLKSQIDTVAYTLDKEDDFLDAISRGDKFAASALLNEVLGDIFFHSGQNFEVIRSRVLELIVLLSRASIKGGANIDSVFELNYKYLKEIHTLDNIQDITYWLNKVMIRFTETIFKFETVKHGNTLHKAIEYMKSNYMNKLTLDEVSSHVFLSPAYLSKIFKEETNYNFISYLNIIRIEQSKKLLHDNSIDIADISNIVGFEDQSYFSRVFKKIVGITPGRYRQSRK